MQLSIIVPVYNEEKTVQLLVEKLFQVDYTVSFEVIVVNDGSTDGTYEKLVEARNRHPEIKLISYTRNRGKGYAIRKGISFASGEIIVIQDADLEYSPNEVPHLIRPILEGKAVAVYGNRFSKVSNIKKLRFDYRLGNFLLAKITNCIFKTKLMDIETCYKAVRKSVLERLNLEDDGFGIEPEITAKILKSGYKILELPISYEPRTHKEGKKIKWLDGLKSVFVLLKVALKEVGEQKAKNSFEK